MKLAVCTICPHFQFEGQWWSYEPFVLEMDLWADLFDEVFIVGPLEAAGRKPQFSPYRNSSRLRILPTRVNRGSGLGQPRTSVLELPRMLVQLVRACRKADVVHVRTPGNIALPALLLVPLLCRRRIAKHAGQWNGYPGEAWTYRLQRWLLKSRWWGAPVTVYGDWPSQPRHVIPFFTSILTEQQMGLARESARRKVEIGKAESRNWESRKQTLSEPQTQRLTPRQPRSAGGESAEHGAGSVEAGNQSPKRSAGGGGSKGTPSLSAAAAFVPGSVGCSDSVRCVDSGLRVLFVGRLSRAKHVDAVIAAVTTLRAKGLAVEGTIVGDGPERERLEALAAEKDGSSRHPTPDTPSPKRAPRIPHPESGIPHHRSPITDHRSPPSPPWIRFAGGLPFDQVLDCYREHDVLVLASETEGWPKAIAEAMVFGLICIGSNCSIIPQMLGDGRGFLVEPGDRAGLISRLRQIAVMPAGERAEMSRRAAEWGQRYTLENLREALRNLMEEWWG